MTFWDEQVPSLVDPKKKFPRHVYFQLIDYHATLANQQSAQLLTLVRGLTNLVSKQNDEITLLREDVSTLTQTVNNRPSGG